MKLPVRVENNKVIIESKKMKRDVAYMVYYKGEKYAIFLREHGLVEIYEVFEMEI